ncbi:hypothetical protein AC1031_013985 [Aphanomyces cochlioides]|nr:hypothetical protein AC1031_013985 [Aphanomyces cochlioides]
MVHFEREIASDVASPHSWIQTFGRAAPAVASAEFNRSSHGRHCSTIQWRIYLRSHQGTNLKAPSQSDFQAHSDAMNQVHDNADLDLTSILEPWELSPEDIQVDLNDMKTILGIGGFATVFKGTYQGQSVAVKRLDRVHGDNLVEFRNLIAKEINGWKEISHEPYILTLIGVCTTISAPIIVTELCQTNIRRYVRDRPETLLPVVYQFAKGLASIHDANMIHQNLKGDNVLVTFQKTVVIADFGESKM